MKEILNNTDTLDGKRIDSEVRRAKLLFINKKNNKCIIATSAGNYQIIGGHAEKGESDRDCIIREIYEETGLKVNLKDDIKPFISIKYYCEKYPNEYINTLYNANYYIYDYEDDYNINPGNLTEEEVMGDFHCEELDLDTIIETLEKSLENATHPMVVNDTMEVLKEFLEIKDNYESTNS